MLQDSVIAESQSHVYNICQLHNRYSHLVSHVIYFTSVVSNGGRQKASKAVNSYCKNVIIFTYLARGKLHGPPLLNCPGGVTQRSKLW